jgi:hypothetical protein
LLEAFLNVSRDSLSALQGLGQAGDSEMQESTSGLTD